jgi:hypothetical protein
LLPAEVKLVEACALGKIAKIAKHRPDRMTPTNRVRAQFLRFLALGGDEKVCVHEAGPQLRGAWISGKLDFEACDIPLPITLYRCHIDSRLILRDAKLPGIFLERTSLGKLDAERLDCPGSVRINDSVAYGQVSFTSARIGGDVDCVGSHFFDDEKDCFQCDGAKIGGDLTLGHTYSNESFFAHGTANFSGAEIDGDVRCNAAQFEGEV